MLQILALGAGAGQCPDDQFASLYQRGTVPLDQSVGEACLA
ncbi:hypothetical protein [Acidocella sp.]